MDSQSAFTNYQIAGMGIAAILAQATVAGSEMSLGTAFTMLNSVGIVGSIFYAGKYIARLEALETRTADSGTRDADVAVLKTEIKNLNEKMDDLKTMLSVLSEFSHSNLSANERFRTTPHH